eukprot:GFKZ01002443.1.p1 GENE.GFKZ01002443.1~~GFKZ01002443.1.p1  ORF type:complete len:385 (+),score=66.25 GFKZ01002443.1:170-1324(+)
MGVKANLDAKLASKLPSLPPGLILGTPTTPYQLVSHHATPPGPTSIPAAQWTASHVSQVTAMSPGGIQILAIYTPTPVTEIDTALSAARLANVPMILCKGSKGKIVAKQLHDSKTSTVDLKLVDSLISTCINVAARVQMKIWGGETDVARALQSSILVLADDVIIADESADSQLFVAMGWTEDEGEQLAAEILLPIGAKSRESESSTCVQGGLHVEAVVSRACTVGDVLRYVREDIQRSVKARWQVLREMQEDDQGEGGLAEGDNGAQVVPVRVVARAAGRLPMSEYMVEGEVMMEDVRDRFVEVLSWDDEDIDAYELKQAERFAQIIDASKNESVPPLDMDTIESEEAAESEDQAGAEALLHFMVGSSVVIAILAILYKNLFT